MAKHYEELGGDCIYFGKPQVAHFEACLRKLGLDPSTVAHVGDSLHHDVAGANAAGVSSVFVTSGIHQDDFEEPIGSLPASESLEALFKRTDNVVPDHVVSTFRL